ELNTDIGSIVTVPDGRDSAPVVSDKSSIEALPSGLDRSTVVEPQLYTVSVGPLINSTDIYQAVKSLQELGFQPQMTPGSGPVKMFRLFEGIYSVSEARIHLAALKKNVGSAFMLPTGNKMAVYAGSFHQETRAKLMQNNLVAEKIKVELVSTEVVMNGTMLTVLQADKQTASEILADIAGLGLFARMEVKK
ncbi:MAG: hypothetical protein KAU22_08240, partial [Desulfuromonadales bacterium]|nr:hypothetical protein [Desulfuromonadales bacterium]